MEIQDKDFETAWKYHARKENRDAKGRIKKFEASVYWRHYNLERHADFKSKNLNIASKEKSIKSLIIRMKELEADLRYETKLNEQIRSENERLKSFIKNKLKINA